MIIEKTMTTTTYLIIRYPNQKLGFTRTSTKQMFTHALTYFSTHKSKIMRNPLAKERIEYIEEEK
jgi:hypothetical protein